MNRILLFIFILLCCVGCKGSGGYAKDRIMDLTDVIDFKVGAVSLGVGAKVEVTDYIGGGLGLGLVGWSREFFGRRSESSGLLGFLHLGLFGIEGGGFSELYDRSILLYHGTFQGERRIPMHSRFRVGGEVVLPVVSLGAYLNLGELLDFFLGFGRIDIASDDGLPKGTSFWTYEPFKGSAERAAKINKIIDQVREGDLPEKEEAIETLKEMHAIQSMDVLIEVLESDLPANIKEKAGKTMEEFTGLEYGTDAAAWRAWWDVE